MTDTNNPLMTATLFNFFSVNRRRTPTTVITTKKRAMAEMIKNRLQYFLPKGPNKEFIYT
jgi:hypothetical protein